MTVTAVFHRVVFNEAQSDPKISVLDNAISFDIKGKGIIANATRREVGIRAIS